MALSLEDAAVLLRVSTTTCATSVRIWLRKLAAASVTGFAAAASSAANVAGVGP